MGMIFSLEIEAFEGYTRETLTVEKGNTKKQMPKLIAMVQSFMTGWTNLKSQQLNAESTGNHS